MTGTEILQMMEENIERTFSYDPFEQRGGYVKRFRGLTFRVKLENPKDFRIEGQHARMRRLNLAEPTK